MVKRGSGEEDSGEGKPKASSESGGGSKAPAMDLKEMVSKLDSFGYSHDNIEKVMEKKRRRC